MYQCLQSSPRIAVNSPISSPPAPFSTVPHAGMEGAGTQVSLCSLIGSTPGPFFIVTTDGERLMYQRIIKIKVGKTHCIKSSPPPPTPKQGIPYNILFNLILNVPCNSAFILSFGR